jgi:hypothetical protein
MPASCENKPEVLGFYWTASARSLCIRRNAVPALKVGAPSEKGGTSPVAVFYNGLVRKLTPSETFRIQGFDSSLAAQCKYGDALRMAGDAVSRPVGAFVVDSVLNGKDSPDIEIRPVELGKVPSHGYFHNNYLWSIRHSRYIRALNLWDFLEHAETRSLSPQACAGLCCRIIRADAEVPYDLFLSLYETSKTRTSLIGTKVNSFEILHSQLDPIRYLDKLSRTWNPEQRNLFEE